MRVPVPPPTLFVLAAVAARRRRILRAFEEAGADRPERARTLAELGVRESHLASRLARSGVLASVDGGRYYLSADGLARWNRRRNAYVLTAVLTTLGVLAVLALVLMWVSRGR
jgi:hypothetical protein